jgi:hypothetical protein
MSNQIRRMQAEQQGRSHEAAFYNKVPTFDSKEEGGGKYIPVGSGKDFFKKGLAEAKNKDLAASNNTQNIINRRNNQPHSRR